MQVFSFLPSQQKGKYLIPLRSLRLCGENSWHNQLTIWICDRYCYGTGVAAEGGDDGGVSPHTAGNNDNDFIRIINKWNLIVLI